MAKRILVVDDQEIIRNLVTVAIAQPEMWITEAASGEEALGRVMANETFDLVITDNTMPGGMTGKELISRIRRLPGNKGETPIILLSGDRGLTCEECQVDAIIRKPFRFDVVRVVADTIIAK